MPSRQAGGHGARKQAALLYNLQRRIDEQEIFASMMQTAGVQVMGLRVLEPTTHITPLPFIQTLWD